MKQNKFAPLYPPGRPDSPDHIPHYPEWPYAPHADWPHGYGHRWNDSEPAHTVPYPYDCCNPDDSECICVTSADMALWNSYSGLSGLTAFDAESLSAIYDKVLDMDDYSAVRDCYYTVSANSAIWNSAAYIPNLYENISALYNDINEKADYSAISSYCDIGIHEDGTKGDGSIRIWSDSLKDYYYGNRVPHDMTIVGDGSLDRPLRVGKDIVMAAMSVIEATSASSLANQEDISKLAGSISKNMYDIRDNASDIKEIFKILTTIEDSIAEGGGAKFIKSAPSRIVADSSRDPINFYYC